jgi:hypothetical protein
MRTIVAIWRRSRQCPNTMIIAPGTARGARQPATDGDRNFVRTPTRVFASINVWGGYEHMIEDGVFTWTRPFWEQPLWRWDAMFSAGVRAHYQAGQFAPRGRCRPVHHCLCD